METLSTTRIFGCSAILVLMMLTWSPMTQADPTKERPLESIEKSDLNKDGVVDGDDLLILGSRYLKNHKSVIDWCGFYDATVSGLNFDSKAKKGKKNPRKGKPTKFYKKHFKLMLTFINDEFVCDADPQPDPDLLTLENEPRYQVRMAKSTDGSGDIYVTDFVVGSIFIYDADLVLKAEIKDLDKPLGIDVDSKGYILVGNDGRDNIEVFDPANGNLKKIFGEGLVIMPNSISVGPDGNIYVTDSRSHRVKVFNADYEFLGTIGSPGSAEDELTFPVDTEVISYLQDGNMVREVFVADQGNKRIQIYDTEGNHLASINQGRCSFWRGCQPPVLANIQSMDLDPAGRLHVLDNFEATVTIHDPVSGAYITRYGEYGEEQGFLKMPMGLVISDTGLSFLTSGVNNWIEVYLAE
jgi:sugar lactone lactonase YvrE